MATISFNVLSPDSVHTIKANVNNRISLGRSSVKSVSGMVSNVRITCRKDQIDSILDGDLHSLEQIYAIDSLGFWL